MTFHDLDVADVVITDCDHRSVDDEVELLRSAGFSVAVAQCSTSDDVLAVARDSRVIITQYASIDLDVFAGLTRCAGVVRYGVGVDNIDLVAARDHGVVVANVPDYGVAEVASHAVMLALALLRGLPSLQASVAEGTWDYQVAIPLRRLDTLTAGVVGCGRIGSRAARMFEALGMTVVVADPALDPTTAGEEPFEVVSFDELIERSDVVSVHTPLDDSTRHLIDADVLARMKPGAYLVNTARGAVVDTEALLRSLDGGHLAGAGLDVLETEPPGAESRLAGHPRTIVTPHAAWYSEEAYRALKRGVAEEALRLLRGEPVRNPVLPTAALVEPRTAGNGR